MNKLLSKSKYLQGWQCLKQVYLVVNHPDLFFTTLPSPGFEGDDTFGRQSEPQTPHDSGEKRK